MSIPENSHTIALFDEKLMLLPQKAIYIERYKTLFVSDIHLGKTGHFRNAGIAIPGGLAEADLVALSEISREVEIENLIILGDLFHAGINYDIRLFDRWRNIHHDMDISLIKGNHDILSDEIYKHFEIILHNKYLLWNNFLLTHKPLAVDIKLNGCNYIFCGHVHPGVRLTGKGKQSLSLPCFHFTEKQCTLPAFGEFTGKHIIKPNGKDKVYVVTKSDNEFAVLKVHG